MPEPLGLGLTFVIAGLVGYWLRSRKTEAYVLSQSKVIKSEARRRAIARSFSASRWTGVILIAVGAVLVAAYLVERIITAV